MQDKLRAISEAIHESQIMTAVIFGMFIQYFFGSNKTFKIASAIIVSSVFVAMYIVSPVIEIIGISEDSKIAISMYALSSLISMEALAILLTLMPLAFREKLSKYLGVKNDSK